MQKMLKYLFLFLVGGTVYYLMEVIYRGFSHPSMFILGGICFILIGAINLRFGRISIIAQMLLGGVIITTLEFITGVWVNVYLGLNVWDYSDRPLNLMGQICIEYFVLWIGLSVLAIFADDFLRHIFFHENYPIYKFF